jgi:hypothetical protein
MDRRRAASAGEALVPARGRRVTPPGMNKTRREKAVPADAQAVARRVKHAAVGAAGRHGQAAVSGVPLLVRRVVRPARVTLPGLCRVRHQAGVSVGIITAALHRSQRQRLPAGRWSGRTPAPRFANQSATPCGSMSSPGSSTRSGSGRRYSSACSTAIIRSLPVANFCRISPIGASPGTMR